MTNDGLATLRRIRVVFEDREDGGLRVFSNEVPGFALSHPDAEAVLQDVQPALEMIISALMGTPVTVAPVDEETALPWFRGRRVREYETRRAA